MHSYFSIEQLQFEYMNDPSTTISAVATVVENNASHEIFHTCLQHLTNKQTNKDTNNNNTHFTTHELEV